MLLLLALLSACKQHHGARVQEHGVEIVKNAQTVMPEMSLTASPPAHHEETPPITTLERIVRELEYGMPIRKACFAVSTKLGSIACAITKYNGDQGFAEIRIFGNDATEPRWWRYIEGTSNGWSYLAESTMNRAQLYAAKQALVARGYNADAMDDSQAGVRLNTTEDNSVVTATLAGLELRARRVLPKSNIGYCGTEPHNDSIELKCQQRWIVVQSVPPPKLYECWEGMDFIEHTIALANPHLLLVETLGQIVSGTRRRDFDSYGGVETSELRRVDEYDLAKLCPSLVAERK